MFDGRRDDLARSGNALSADMIAVASDSVPHDVKTISDSCCGPEQFLHLAAGLFQRPADAVAEAVHRRRVAELLGEERQHGLDDLRINLGGALLSR